MTAGRPLKFQSVEELESKIEEFFEEMKKDKRPLTVTNLAIYLNVDRRTITNYDGKDEFIPTIKRAKERILAWKEEQLYRTTQVAGTIFDLKNNYSDIYKEKQEIDHKGEVTLNFDKQDENL